jgi:uncharacterized repeat protein (TIGR03803 family)
MNRSDGWKWTCAVLLFYAATVIPSAAQNFRVLASFDGTNGAGPEYVSPVQGRDGNFYGTTSHGGGYGSIFKVTRGGMLTALLNLNGNNGCCPVAGLVHATDGNFYGTGYGGGANGYGTIFKITPAGTLTTLYSFCAKSGCADGDSPEAALIQADDGSFYGTTQFGGLGNCGYGCGTVFKITPGGVLTTLYAFDYSDGFPPVGGLIQGIDRNFYGTTSRTVFKITPGGTLTTLYTFCSETNCADGNSPYDTLVQGTDGNFYGTTYAGGTNCVPVGGCGTIFKITRGGTLTTLHSFAGPPTEGAYPYAGLVQGTDGNFYGTTDGGGSASECNGGCGTAFEITSGGALNTLHNFNYNGDGGFVNGGLLQATDGRFYGTAAGGGAYGTNGTIFSLSVGLGPFVAFVRDSGKVGTKLEILGQGLKGTTAVSFNGTAASFKIVSGTYITAIVPNNATTGFVTVTTLKRDLKSNKKFRVIR